ncbi:glycosyltransferase family 2 protein [Hymenobacter properus]|uniref:Glycosyltransferase family 2 protein n=1 Tax=Hymenobacter properus TaxID=2791026 RepID=A0A931FL83_9BACT|nr:glycosyltransferase family 2 protein [Hymenobacter properus]MBF9143893.1 glycosyltransferase family 2 protein [Hymenobacter properus]MBR7722707.1 glycosyltransferase family 2 protein [Microvirga sp. SRT04]
MDKPLTSAGLSVLIPIYNWDVRELVHTLLAQRAGWPGPVEILLFDDGSRPEFLNTNRPLGALPGVHYQELPRNVGRAAIRNRLAAAAQHEWLLLLDNDSLAPDGQFLARYATAAGRADVVIGGTSYRASPPADPALRLRWLYGQAREARPAAVRQAAPYGQLTINNALMRADIFRRFTLDERLNGYGHEDTKFGLALAAASILLLHIDNPVLHEGLEPATVFLQKSEQAVRNLAQLYRTENLGTESRLLQTALRLRRLGLGGATRAALEVAAPALRRQLLSAQPRLRAFDLLKLYWLLRELA